MAPVEARADLGLIGLAVMGQNLVLNLNDNGFTVCVFNRTVATTHRFLENEAKNTNVIGSDTLEEFAANLKTPRVIILLVKAGKPVDEFIAKLMPFLSHGDIVIDGGNSEFTDTNRRCQSLKEHGLLYVGCGVSGGEIGARYGPSMMPGGSEEAWPRIKPFLTAIAAKANDGEPCCCWIGPNGSGHYVKMIHNGIEYADMQIICEAFDIMLRVLKMSYSEMAQVFAEWNEGGLSSYLIDITAKILAYNDSNGDPLLPQILDKAGQKGTGKWSVHHTLELGQPVTLIAEAVFSRFLSSLVEERASASTALDEQLIGEPPLDKAAFIESIRQALYASKIVCYAQGLMMLRAAEDQFGSQFDIASICRIWRSGCIIKSVLLYQISQAYTQNGDLKNLMLDGFFKEALAKCQKGWRTTISTAVQRGIPVPCFSAALAFYDGYRSASLPANLIQAQRDFFGAHTYELKNRPGVVEHCDWTGQGGKTTASNYNN